VVGCNVSTAHSGVPPMLKPFLPQPDNKAKQNANKTILLFIPSLYSIFNDVHFVAKWFIVITLSGIGEN
jgi:hypothetical protein